VETEEAVKAAAALEGPVFLRISRFPVPNIARPAGARFTIGKAETLRDGNDVAIIANGTMVSRALDAAAALAAEGVAARVINLSTIAPWTGMRSSRRLGPAPS